MYPIEREETHNCLYADKNWELSSDWEENIEYFIKWFPVGELKQMKICNSNKKSKLPLGY